MVRNVKKWPFQTTCSKTAFFKRTVHFWVCFQRACLQLILFTNQLFALDLLTNDLLNISSAYYVKNCLLYYFFQLFLLPQETCLHHPGGLYTIFYLQYYKRPVFKCFFTNGGLLRNGLYKVPLNKRLLFETTCIIAVQCIATCIIAVQCIAWVL